MENFHSPPYTTPLCEVLYGSPSPRLKWTNVIKNPAGLKFKCHKGANFENGVIKKFYQQKIFFQIWILFDMLFLNQLTIPDFNILNQKQSVVIDLMAVIERYFH